MSDDEEEVEEKKERKSGLLEQKLFDLRTVTIFGEINQKISEATTIHLLALAKASSDPINIIINSPGGHVESGYTIHDMIKFVNNKVNIIGTGWVASAGLLIFVAAEKANRYCLPNTRFLLHQPLGGVGGTSSEIEIQAEEIIKTKQRINNIIAKATGQKVSKIQEDGERDFWLDPEEAKEYGIVDNLISSINEIK